MKVGDLVRDKDWIHVEYRGIIVDVDEPEGIFKVAWFNRGKLGKEWLTEMYMEVVSESR